MAYGNEGASAAEGGMGSASSMGGHRGGSGFGGGGGISGRGSGGSTGDPALDRAIDAALEAALSPVFSRMPDARQSFQDFQSIIQGINKKTNRNPFHPDYPDDDFANSLIDTAARYGLDVPSSMGWDIGTGIGKAAVKTLAAPAMVPGVNLAIDYVGNAINREGKFEGVEKAALGDKYSPKNVTQVDHGTGGENYGTQNIAQYINNLIQTSSRSRSRRAGVANELLRKLGVA